MRADVVVIVSCRVVFGEMEMESDEMRILVSRVAKFILATSA